MGYESSVPQKVLAYVMERDIVSVEDLVRDLTVSHVTARNYLSRLAQMGAIKSIGRGVYQLGKGETATVRLSPELSRLAQEIRERFPMATFAVWSLNMLADYAHYTMGRDIIFIETSKMLSASFRDALVAKGYRTILLPENREFREYAYYGERVLFILERKELYGLAWFEGNLIPTPERIWVDIFYLITRKHLAFDLVELGLIFANMINKEGINFDRLLRYSGRRGLFREVLFFLYEVKSSGSRTGKRIPEDVLVGKHETGKAILEMVSGATKE